LLLSLFINGKYNEKK